jgi:hypothetical protein
MQFRPKVVMDFTIDTNFVMNCMGSNKKVGLLYTSHNFRRENARGEERWWLSYIITPIIASAHHLEYEYLDTPKIGSKLPCYAVRHKFRGTFYGPPINVETFRFC